MTNDTTAPGVDADSADGAPFMAAALRLDVRKPAAFAAATHRLPGARWQDPGQIEQWLVDLPAGAAVLVYCVHGHEVSQGAAARLRAAGFDARYLVGGFDAWAAAGRPLDQKAGAA